MSLDWSIEKVENWKELADDQQERVITDTVVFGCMAVGIGKITEENWHEWYARFAWIEKHDGPWMRDGDGPLKMKPEWVKRRIGLSTNVYPHETRSQWIGRLLKNEKIDMNRWIDMEVRTLEMKEAKSDA